ncbi:MAG TPA: hypothetical protein VES97_04785 [Solirubrobacteraceae bacterium]|nr:hypothetical protein [Solirubrobacteraceae bacterium]
MQPEQLAHPLALDAKPLSDLIEGQSLDRAQTEHLTLALALDVLAATSERCQAVTVKLADELVQLDAAAELGAADQLAGCVIGELIDFMYAGLGQAGGGSLAQGQFGDAHGWSRASERHQFIEAPRDL